MGATAVRIWVATFSGWIDLVATAIIERVAGSYIVDVFASASFLEAY